MKLLTKEQLSELLQNVSPHSFKHNIVALASKEGIVAASEPVTDAATIREIVRETIEGLESCTQSLYDFMDLDLDQDNENYTHGEELIAGLATLMGSLVIETRMSALQLGVPLEEVQDVMAALLLKNQDNHEEAVNTVLFGLAPTEENNG